MSTFTSITPRVWLRNTRNRFEIRTSIDDGWIERFVERVDDDAPGGDLLAEGSIGEDHELAR